MIALACDHGGFELMKEVRHHLDSIGENYKDFGTYSTESCDYPVVTEVAAKAIIDGECKLGIFICGTGIGMSIAANKIPGIRAGLCTTEYMAEMTRSHNDANVLVLGGRVINKELAINIVDTFLKTDFTNDERHCRRISMLSELDSKRKDAVV